MRVHVKSIDNDAILCLQHKDVKDYDQIGLSELLVVLKAGKPESIKWASKCASTLIAAMFIENLKVKEPNYLSNN